MRSFAARKTLRRACCIPAFETSICRYLRSSGAKKPFSRGHDEFRASLHDARYCTCTRLESSEVQYLTPHTKLQGSERGKNFGRNWGVSLGLAIAFGISKKFAMHRSVVPRCVEIGSNPEQSIYASTRKET
jgi:hypothetical protein